MRFSFQHNKVGGVCVQSEWSRKLHSSKDWMVLAYPLCRCWRGLFELYSKSKTCKIIMLLHFKITLWAFLTWNIFSQQSIMSTGVVTPQNYQIIRLTSCCIGRW